MWTAIVWVSESTLTKSCLLLALLTTTVPFIQIAAPNPWRQQSCFSHGVLAETIFWGLKTALKQCLWSLKDCLHWNPMAKARLPGSRKTWICKGCIALMKMRQAPPNGAIPVFGGGDMTANKCYWFDRGDDFCCNSALTIARFRPTNFATTEVLEGAASSGRRFVSLFCNLQVSFTRLTLHMHVYIHIYIDIYIYTYMLWSYYLGQVWAKFGVFHSSGPS